MGVLNRERIPGVMINQRNADKFGSCTDLAMIKCKQHLFNIIQYNIPTTIATFMKLFFFSVWVIVGSEKLYNLEIRILS